MAGTYEYSYDYQVDILRMCVQDVAFLSRYPEVIQPHYFSVDALGVVARLILELFNRNKEIPTYTSMTQSAAAYYSQFNVHTAVQQNINELIYRIYYERPETGHQLNAQTISDTVCDFARRKSISHGIQRVLDVLEKGGDMDAVMDIMRTSSVVGTSRREGWNFFSEVFGLSEKIRNSKDYCPENKIPFGFNALDRATFGGMGAGQIWTVAAKPKGGKTTLMCNIASSAIDAKRKVFHYSFGDMNKMDVTVKYAQVMTGFTVHALTQQQSLDAIMQRLVAARPGAHLEIIYESPGVMSVQDLYTDVGFRSSQLGISPDLIVVDYANRMKLPDPRNTYRSMSEIYGGLKELGDSYDCAVLTGVQIRRDGKRDAGSPEDISDSWQQVADCDGMIIIQQSNDQAERNEALLSVPIVRRGRSLEGKDAIKVKFIKEKAEFKAI